MRAAVSWVRRLEPVQVLVVGYALFLLYAFPGYMSTDSVQQLTEAHTGTFSDGNPPLMAAEWWVLDRIVAGPVLMLLLQCALFLGGLFVLLRRLLAQRAAAWTAIGILLFPPVLTVMAVIWKDSQMAAYLVAAIAAMLDERRRVRIGGLALLLAAASMRHNGFAAAVPLAAVLFEWTPGQRLWKRLVVIAVIACLTVGLAFGITHVLAKTHVKLTPVFSDIVAVIACTDDRTDDDLREVLRGTPLAIDEGIQAQARLLHAFHDTFRIVSGDDRLFDPPRNDADWDALNHAWRKLVLGDPLAYLRCHGDDFEIILGMNGVDLRAPVWNLFLEDKKQADGTEHDASWSTLQAKVGLALDFLAYDTPLFRPCVYFWLALIALVVFCRDRLVLALLSSGLLYELSFFPVGAEPDYRYSHWMVTSTCLAMVIVFIQRRRRSA
jgi:hypothetical protein